MLEVTLCIFAAFAIMAIAKVLKPLLVPLIVLLFKKQLNATESALSQPDKIEECSFDSFPEICKKAFEPILLELKESGYKLLVDYRNPGMDLAGGGSYSSIWVKDSRWVACLSYITLGTGLKLIDFFGGSCAGNFGDSTLSIVLESTSSCGERLFTYSGEQLLPEMPVRYKVKTLEPGEPLSRIEEVHRKRMKAWIENGKELILYESLSIFFEQQRKQVEELNRFSKDY